MLSVKIMINDFYYRSRLESFKIAKCVRKVVVKYTRHCFLWGLRSIDMTKNMSKDVFLHSCIYRKVYFARKINLSISKNHIISQILGNKNQDFHRSSVKNQIQKFFFFLSALTLNWRHTWKPASAWIFCAAYLATCVIQNARFAKSGRCAQLWHHPERTSKG